MNTHPGARQLEQYVRGELAPGDSLRVHRHLLSCPACAEAYGFVRPPAEGYAALRAALLTGEGEEPFHLGEQDARDYLLGQADHVNTELAETHLEDCRACAEMVAEMRQAGGGLQVNTDTLPFTPQAARGATSHPPLFSLHGRTRLKFAASLVLVLIGLSIFLIVQRGDRPNAGGQVAGISPQNLPGPPSQGPQYLPPRATPGQNELAPTPNADFSPKPPVRPRSQARTSTPSVALLDGGRIIILTRGGELTGLPPLPPGLRRDVAAALASGHVQTPDALAELKGSRSVMLGETSDGVPFRLLSPVGVITAERLPQLRWSPLPGASSYSVTVTDASHDEVASSGPLAGTEWKVPVALEPGKTYNWQVSARRGGEEIVSPVLPAPAARFRLLTRAQAEELRRARRKYADSHLVLGVIYARAGLIDEAAREFRVLSVANPNSAIPVKLIRKVQ
jgi:hypothetical protein